jgi:hypothetical protein
MTTRWLLCDLLSGRQILDLNVMTGTWSLGLNQADTVQVSIDMQDPAMIALGLRNAATPAKTILACAEDDTILAAGPIWSRNYDRDAKTLQLSAKGIWSYFDHRFIQQLLAATVDVTQFTLPDPANPGGSIPNPALATNLQNVDLGTIAKQLMQLAQSWTNSTIPLVFMDDRAGTRVRNYQGADFTNLGDALRALTEVDGGPDIIFTPQFTPDRLGIQWYVRTGTETVPQLYSNAVQRWDLTLPDSSASNLEVDEDASAICSIAWLTGGRATDDVLVARSLDGTLISQGFPLYEELDSSHTSVSEQDTLNAYAVEATTYGRGAVETWTFTAEAHRQPLVGSYTIGDFVDLQIGAYDTINGSGDPYLLPGRYRQRIVGLSGDQDGLQVKVTCAPGRG